MKDSISLPWLLTILKMYIFRIGIFVNVFEMILKHYECILDCKYVQK